MSLINDALKRAQRQRTRENTPLPPMPGTDSGTAARIARRGRPLDFRSLSVRLGLGAAVLLFLIAAGSLVWYFATRPSAPVPQTASAPAASSAPEAAEPSPTPAPEAAAPPRPVVPVEVPPAKTIPPVVATQANPPPPVVSTRASVPAGTGLGEPAAAPAPSPPVASVRPDPRILAFVDNLRVTGIRSAGADSKVLMNDRVYRLNDVVDHQLGLKLTAVGADALTFTDERGAVYRKDF